MALSEIKRKEFSRRILVARMQILLNHGFFGLLLMHMKFSIEDDIETACTDGENIIFGAEFLDSLTDNELVFVMMHEIMHIVLQHCTRKGKYLHEPFNIAADIVVNSNILLENGSNPNSITIGKYGECMHVAPDGKEGYNYSVEEVYHMLLNPNTDKNACDGADGDKSAKDSSQSDQGYSQSDNSNSPSSWDNHSRWTTIANTDAHNDIWAKRIIDAAEAIKIQKSMQSCGRLPALVNRILEEFRKPQIDWRTILNEFVQEEIVDYSFSPPDKRFYETPFYLPDFNAPDETVKNILFMIDTSASMSDIMIAAAYSEIKGAIDQYDGKLSGKLGFFDAEIVEPKPFYDTNQLKCIKPKGGGGTNFDIIFEYVNKFMYDDQPVSIIILTDGYAKFPNQELANNIPVLWLLNNDYVQPPWGKVARINVPAD